MNTLENQVSPFQYGDIKLNETIMINGLPHFTKNAIGEWLEYSDPRVNINKILDRNLYIKNYSVEVKLTSTDGKKYDTRVYCPISFQLIVMESKQPKAQAYKEVVAEFVSHYMYNSDDDIRRTINVVSASRQIQSLTRAITHTHDQFEREMFTNQLYVLCAAIGTPMPNVNKIGQDIEQMTLPI